MNLQQIITGLAVAGGAYWWYTRDGAGVTPNPTGLTPIDSASPSTSPTTAAGATVTTGTNNPPAGGGNPATPPAAPPPAGYATLDPTTAGAPNFSQWVANKLGPGRHMLGADAWNALFSQFSGVPQTADLFNPDNRGEEISLSAYMQRRTGAGLSGLGMAPAFGLPIAAARQLASAGFRSAGAYALRGPNGNHNGGTR